MYRSPVPTIGSIVRFSALTSPTSSSRWGQREGALGPLVLPQVDVEHCPAALWVGASEIRSVIFVWTPVGARATLGRR